MQIIEQIGLICAMNPLLYELLLECEGMMSSKKRNEWVSFPPNLDALAETRQEYPPCTRRPTLKEDVLEASSSKLRERRN